MRRPFVLMLTAGVMLLAACAPVTPAPAVPPNVPPTEKPAMPTEGSATQMPGQDEMVRQSTAFLEQQFKIASDAVTVKEVTPMSWPDASLGCPKIGVMYIQVVTPGLQIVLDANGHTFTFHTDAKDRVVLCKVNPPDEAYPTPER